jgi:hypothetical protein
MPEPARTPHAHAVTANPAPAILFAGLATSLLALGAVWALNVHADENVMGWYANYVLPAGAILVGGVASSGFGLASWLTGAKITGRLLVATTAVLLAGYWAAQYLEFRAAFPDGAYFEDGTQARLLDWYDFATRSFAWKEHGKLGAPLGAWGYALRAGEMVGFAGGGLIAPILLRKAPYCAACRVYMRSPLVAVIPAGIKPKKVSKKDAAALEARDAASRGAWDRGQAALATLYAAGSAGDPAAFRLAVDAAGPPAGTRKTEKLSARVHVRVVHCPRCAAGELRAQVATGQGSNLKLEPLSAHVLERGLAPRLVARKGRAVAS